MAEALKKALINQLDGLVRKGKIPERDARLLITKIELADERFLKMALDKFATLRKAPAKDDEDDAENPQEPGAEEQ